MGRPWSGTSHSDRLSSYRKPPTGRPSTRSASLSLLLLLLKPLLLLLSGCMPSISARDFLKEKRDTCVRNSSQTVLNQGHMFSFLAYLLLLLSVTTHSTWSRRQFVHGEPLSTTSQRTLRARQQQQALEALRLTGRLPAVFSPAVEAFLLLKLRLAGCSLIMAIFERTCIQGRNR